jgi:hypothetical protein
MLILFIIDGIAQFSDLIMLFRPVAVRSTRGVLMHQMSKNGGVLSSDEMVMVMLDGLA